MATVGASPAGPPSQGLRGRANDRAAPTIIDRTGIIDEARTNVVPALIAAAWRVFAANILNPHTRRAYSRAVSEFMARCEDNG